MIGGLPLYCVMVHGRCRLQRSCVCLAANLQRCFGGGPIRLIMLISFQSTMLAALAPEYSFNLQVLPYNDAQRVIEPTSTIK